MRSCNRMMVLIAFGIGLLSAVEGRADDKIVGGRPAAAGSWPWQVAIVAAGNTDNADAQFCGGSLIGPRWVLTAAHCVAEGGVVTSPASIKVLMGTHSLSTGGRRLAVERIVVHPAYDEATSDNDIALVKLSSTVLGRAIRLMTPELEPQLLPLGITGTVTGWGRTNPSTGDAARDTQPIFNPQLMQVDLPIVARTRCQALYDPFTSNMLCAGVQTGGKDSCQGDSGGPLMVADSLGGWVQAGIVSFGRGCAQRGVFGAYTRVARYHHWVQSEVGSVTGSPVLSVARVGNGSGTITSSPAGINCGDTCSAAFSKNVPVMATARAAPGSVFGGWSGQCSGLRATMVVPMRGNKSCVALFNAVGQAPVNDAFSAAARISGASGRTSGNNNRAGAEVGEPHHAGSGGRRSVWWRWVAPDARTYTFFTDGSGFDTVLAAYSGPRLGRLVEVAANDNTRTNNSD
ncbi:MAG TPA: serine protease, partial [Azospirillaceae bacterium]|nr:serine protease [Azospirillaceae bacterium]